MAAAVLVKSRVVVVVEEEDVPNTDDANEGGSLIMAPDCSVYCQVHRE
jgi:hypothetical protein